MIIDSPIISGSFAASGSLNQSGDVVISGSLTITGGITGSISGSAISASYAANANSASYALTASYSANVPVTASYANNANSASFATTASNALTASYLSGYVSPFPFTGSAIISGSLEVTGSANIPNITGSLSGSLNGTASYAVTASNAVTASYLTGYVSPFPFTGSAVISGSLGVTGSLQVTNLSGSGVRYLVADESGSVTAQSASAALKSTQAFTSSAGQTSFSVTNGYTTGYVDVFINGIKLSAGEFTDTSGTNVVLTTGSFDGDIVEVVKYLPADGVSTNVLRTQTNFVATAGQTVFSASYAPGLLDIFYNGSRLSYTEYTANNGTYFTLATASNAGDVLDVFNYSYQIGGFTGIGGNGAANQVPYFYTTHSITGSPNLTFDGSTLLLTGSFTISGSSTFTNIGPAVMSGSLNVSGAITTNSTITAQTLVVQTITSSVSVITGSTNWGSLAANTHTFTGSVYMNTNGLFVSSSGNVGISTLAPNHQLAVYNSARNATTAINAGNSNTIPVISIQSDVNAWTDASNGFAFIYNADNGNLDLYRKQGSTTQSQVMTWVRSNSNVGIGTTGPNTKLQILGSTLTVSDQSTYALGIGNSSGYDLTLGTNTSYSYIQSWTSRPLSINSQGNNVIFPNSSTSVGIGTTSPGANLHIYGSANFVQMRIENTTAWYALYQAKSSNASNFWQWGSWADGTYRIGQNNVGDYITIKQTGAVGIGTTNPSKTLEVNGRMSTSAIVSGNLIAGNIYSNISTSPSFIIVCNLNNAAGFSLSGKINAASYTCWNISDVYIRKDYSSLSGQAVITGVAKSGCDFSVVDISYAGDRFIALRFTGNPEIDVLWTGYRLNELFASDGTATVLTSGVTVNSTYASY